MRKSLFILLLASASCLADSASNIVTNSPIDEQEMYNNSYLLSRKSKLLMAVGIMRQILDGRRSVHINKQGRPTPGIESHADDPLTPHRDLGGEALPCILWSGLNGIIGGRSNCLPSLPRPSGSTLYFESFRQPK